MGQFFQELKRRHVIRIGISDAAIRNLAAELTETDSWVGKSLRRSRHRDKQPLCLKY